LAQHGLDPAEAPGVRIVARRYAEVALERALQVERADADLLGEFAEPRRAVLAILERALDETAGEAHPLDGGICRFQLARMAAPAGAVSGALGRLGKLKEFDIVPQRAPAGAGRAAIDMCRAHGINERAISTTRPFLHGVPVLFLGHRTHHVP